MPKSVKPVFTDAPAGLGAFCFCSQINPITTRFTARLNAWDHGKTT